MSRHKVIITPRAEADLENQFSWGLEGFGERVAGRTLERTRRFIETSIGEHPRAGKFLPRAGIFEAWIPRTPFVVFYRIEPAADRSEMAIVRILALFHHAQDRSKFAVDDEA